MDILFSLFNVNFIEYQMKCFSFLKEYLKHRDLSDVLQLLKIFIYFILFFFFDKEQTLSFFFGLSYWKESMRKEVHFRGANMDDVDPLK